MLVIFPTHSVYLLCVILTINHDPLHTTFTDLSDQWTDSVLSARYGPGAN